MIRWTAPVSWKRITYHTEHVGTTKTLRVIVHNTYTVLCVCVCVCVCVWRDLLISVQNFLTAHSLCLAEHGLKTSWVLWVNLSNYNLRDGRRMEEGSSSKTVLKSPFLNICIAAIESNERFSAHMCLKPLFFLYCKCSICMSFHVLHWNKCNLN